MYPTINKYYAIILCTLKVETSNVLLKEGGVQLRLTLVDTPGFGDAVDNSNWCVLVSFTTEVYSVNKRCILLIEVYSINRAVFC